MNHLIKITLLCLLMFTSQLVRAGEIISGDVYIISVKSDFVHVQFGTTPTTNQCTLLKKSFLLSKNHPLFNEKFTVLMSAYLSDLVLTVELNPVSPTDNTCSITQATITKIQQ